MIRRHSEAAQRFAERRKREDEAPRLRATIPLLESLELEFRESRAGVQMADVTHKRRVVVERAPALFELTCQDSACKDGGHDITPDVMRALRSGVEHFEGEDMCRGQVGAAECRRVLSFVGTATYRKQG
jgi:hypothetical protein